MCQGRGHRQGLTQHPVTVAESAQLQKGSCREAAHPLGQTDPALLELLAAHKQLLPSPWADTELPARDTRALGRAFPPRRLPPASSCPRTGCWHCRKGDACSGC